MHFGFATQIPSGTLRGSHLEEQCSSEHNEVCPSFIQYLWVNEDGGISSQLFQCGCDSIDLTRHHQMSIRHRLMFGRPTKCSQFPIDQLSLFLDLGSKARAEFGEVSPFAFSYPFICLLPVEILRLWYCRGGWF